MLAKEWFKHHIEQTREAKKEEIEKTKQIQGLEVISKRPSELSHLIIKDLVHTSLPLKDDNLISFVSLSPDHKYIVAGGFDKKLHLFSTSSGS